MGHGVLVVIGTRPEAIKMAPVVLALRRRAPALEVRIALTGQHDELVDRVMDGFELEADFDLGLMKPDQTVYDVLQGTLGGLKGVVRELAPEALLVQGDTATAFAGALVGFLEGVRVGHVEAGLRTSEKRSPFPEEVFRRLTDVAADYHFAPTARAREALLREQAPPERVFLTGNTVVDALEAAAAIDRPVRDEALRGVLADATGRLVLLTAHRRESFGAPLRRVFAAVRRLADRVPDVRIVYPVHPNPNVSGPARELLSGHPGIRLTEPLDYFDLVTALKSAALVLTDSGGIQEEAPTFGTPLLVLRAVTERPEGIDVGAAELVGTDEDAIVERAVAVLERRTPRKPPPNPYGDGRAGERIADILHADLTGEARTLRDWHG